MSFKLDYGENSGDTLDIYLSEIIKDSERTEKDMLKEASEKVKEFIVANLNRHRRTLAIRYKGRPAMADDVKVSIRTGQWGGKTAKISGGKMTGTLWHLVNDGNLYSSPTHFIDNALARLDSDIDSIWDKTMGWLIDTNSI